MNKSSEQNHKTESGSNTADERFSRRGVLKTGIAAGAGVAALAFGHGQSSAQHQPGKTTVSDYTMVLDRKDTALVVIDPQNDVLSESGVSWGLVGDSVKENNTVENFARLFKAAKDEGFGVFITGADELEVVGVQAEMLGHTEERLKLPSGLSQRDAPIPEVREIVERRLVGHEQLERIVVEDRQYPGFGAG